MIIIWSDKTKKHLRKLFRSHFSQRDTLDIKKPPALADGFSNKVI